jgi:hypothetical protein
LVAEAKDIHEEQSGSLAGSQTLQSGDECQADVLAVNDLVARFPHSCEVPVRHRLDPAEGRVSIDIDATARRRGFSWVEAWPPLTEEVEADRGGDSVEPSTERSGGLKGRQAAPCSLECVLGSVFGVDTGSQHPVAVAEHAPMMRLDELGEGRVVTPDGPIEQFISGLRSLHQLQLSAGLRASIGRRDRRSTGGTG